MRLMVVLLLLTLESQLAASEMDDAGLYGNVKKDQVSHVSAVEGQSAELPCDVTDSTGSAAGLRLVLWYFAASTIYTYDARGGRGGSTGAHWVSGEAGSRLSFDPGARPATLRISDVTRGDAGVYRCRVDFIQAPTRNPRVNLTVVVPPRTPVIFDELGRQTVDDRLGPYLEGQRVNVTCAAFEGWPPPAVSWTRDDASVAGTWFTAPDGWSRSELALGPLTRADLGSRVTCRATYHAGYPPKLATAAVDMLLPPLSVVMAGADSPLSAGQSSDVTCRVTGSRPEPEVTWWLNGLRLARQLATEDTAGGAAVATLSFTPQVKDDGQRLRCLAVNPQLRRNSVEDARLLSVHYPPIVTLTSWPRDENISAGDTVRMRCNISANPVITDVSWRHDGSPVTSSSAEVTVRNDTLLIRRLRPESAGRYTCAATNSQGAVTSNAISLQVRHRPECRHPLRSAQPASRGYSANITCPAAAHPAATQHRWAWATDHLGTTPDRSLGFLNVSGATISVPVPVDGPLPTLLCWASNELGEQYKPCVINLAPAAGPRRPWRPQQCGVTGRSADSIRLTCVPGHNGGERQTFLVQVFRAADSRRQANVTSTDPSFEVAGLSPGETYALHVYALNPLGASTPLTLLARTDAQADSETASSSSAQFLAGIPLLALLGLLLLVGAVLALARCWRSRRQTAKDGRPAVSSIHAMTAVDEREGHGGCHSPDLIPPPAAGNGYPTSRDPPPPPAAAGGGWSDDVTPEAVSDWPAAERVTSHQDHMGAVRYAPQEQPLPGPDVSHRDWPSVVRFAPEEGIRPDWTPPQEGHRPFRTLPRQGHSVVRTLPRQGSTPVQTLPREGLRHDRGPHQESPGSGSSAPLHPQSAGSGPTEARVCTLPRQPRPPAWLEQPRDWRDTQHRHTAAVHTPTPTERRPGDCAGESSPRHQPLTVSPARSVQFSTPF